MEPIEEYNILTLDYSFNLKIFKDQNHYEGRIEGERRQPSAFDNLFADTYYKPDKESLIEACKAVMIQIGGEIVSFVPHNAE